MEIKKYNKNKFVEKEVISDAQSEITDIVLKSIPFSIVRVMQAYDIYGRISKICGKLPISAYQFKSDFSKTEAIQEKIWINKFFNSSLFQMLTVDVLNDFAKRALDNDNLRDAFLQKVFFAKPRDVKGLLKIINSLN